MKLFVSRSVFFLSAVLLSGNLHVTAQPYLVSELQSTNVVLRWSTNFDCYAVESTTNLASGNWTMSPTPPAMVNGQFALSLSRSNDTARFFRLKQRPLGPPDPVIIVNEEFLTDPIYSEVVEYVTFRSPTNLCDLGTGCPLHYPLDGTLTNTFDASQTIDAAQCSTGDAPLEFQWQLRYPPAIRSGEIYTSSLVLGRNTPHLILPPSCLPALSGADVHWRVILTITKHTPNGVFTTIALFRAQYDSSELLLQDVPP